MPLPLQSKGVDIGERKTMDLIACPTIDFPVRATYGEVNLAYLIVSDLVVTKTPPRLKKVARGVEAEYRQRSATRWPGEGLTNWEALAKRMGLSERADLPAPWALAESIRVGATFEDQLGSRCREYHGYQIRNASGSL